MGDILATLDAAKVATTILFVTSASQTNDGMQREIIDVWGKQIIVSCLAQGLPSTIVTVHNIQKLHVKVSNNMFNTEYHNTQSVKFGEKYLKKYIEFNFFFIVKNSL